MVLARLACILLIGALAQVNVRPVSPSRLETTDRAFKQCSFWYSLSPSHESCPPVRMHSETPLVPSGHVVVVCAAPLLVVGTASLRMLA